MEIKHVFLLNQNGTIPIYLKEYHSIPAILSRCLADAKEALSDFGLACVRAAHEFSAIQEFQHKTGRHHEKTKQINRQRSKAI